MAQEDFGQQWQRGFSGGSDWMNSALDARAKARDKKNLEDANREAGGLSTSRLTPEQRLKQDQYNSDLADQMNANFPEVTAVGDAGPQVPARGLSTTRGDYANEMPDYTDSEMTSRRAKVFSDRGLGPEYARAINQEARSAASEKRDKETFEYTKQTQANAMADRIKAMSKVQIEEAQELYKSTHIKLDKVNSEKSFALLADTDAKDGKFITTTRGPKGGFVYAYGDTPMFGGAELKGWEEAVSRAKAGLGSENMEKYYLYQQDETKRKSDQANKDADTDLKKAEAWYKRLGHPERSGGGDGSVRVAGLERLITSGMEELRNLDKKLLDLDNNNLDPITGKPGRNNADIKVIRGLRNTAQKQLDANKAEIMSAYYDRSGRTAIPEPTREFIESAASIAKYYKLKAEGVVGIDEEYIASFGKLPEPSPEAIDRWKKVEDAAVTQKLTDLQNQKDVKDVFSRYKYTD